MKTRRTFAVTASTAALTLATATIATGPAAAQNINNPDKMTKAITVDNVMTHLEAFQAIADSTDLPVLLYNNPDKVKNNISVRLLERLVDIPNIVGMKDSSGDMTLTAEYIRCTRHKNFKIMAGRDVLIYGTLAYGGVGCVASTANIVPELVVEIYEKFVAGDLAGSLEAQFKLAPMRMAFNLGSFPVATKDAANLIGLDVGKSILPNTTCSPENMAKLKGILKDMGAIKA